MNRETFALSQKELQRVAVISRCVKGELACARAAGLLCLSVRQIKRLKKRMREDGEAALAHASRGRPSHRRLPQAVRERIVQLARGTYAGFNDHHLCEKLVECQGISLSRETLRRLLRLQGLGSPRKRRVRSAQLAELVQLDGSPHDWLEAAARTSPLSACRTTPPAKSWRRSSFPRKPLSAISACFISWFAGTVFRSLFTATTAASSSATTTTGPSKNSSPVNASPPSSAGPSRNSASPSSLPTARRPKAASSVSGACCRIASPANCASPKLMTSTPPTPCCASSSPTTTAALPGRLAKTTPHGARLRIISTVSAASCMNASSATTTSCSGRAAASRSPSRLAASASPEPKCRSIKLLMGASRSTTARPACNTQHYQRGDSFMLPLG